MGAQKVNVKTGLGKLVAKNYTSEVHATGWLGAIVVVVCPFHSLTAHL